MSLSYFARYETWWVLDFKLKVCVCVHVCDHVCSPVCTAAVQHTVWWQEVSVGHDLLKLLCHSASAPARCWSQHHRRRELQGRWESLIATDIWKKGIWKQGFFSSCSKYNYSNLSLMFFMIFHYTDASNSDDPVWNRQNVPSCSLVSGNCVRVRPLCVLSPRFSWRSKWLCVQACVQLPRELRGVHHPQWEQWLPTGRAGDSGGLHPGGPGSTGRGAAGSSKLHVDVLK